MTDFTKPQKVNWLFWVFAAFGLAGVIAVIFIAITIMNIGSRDRDDVVPLAAAEGNIKYTLGDIVDLRGTDLIAISIITDEEALGSGSMKGYNRPLLHNLVFFDRKTKKSRKLLNDNRGLIKSALFLPGNESGIALDFGRMMDDATEIADAAADAVLTANGFESAAERSAFRRKLPLKHYIIIVTNQDSDKMQTSLLIGRLNDGVQSTVMEGIQAVERYWIMSPTELGLIVQENGEVFYRVIDFRTLTVTQSTKIEAS